MSNNGPAHSNCTVTCLQGRSARNKKIVPHRHDISRISDSTISTCHSIRYEIIISVAAKQSTLYIWSDMFKANAPNLTGYVLYMYD